MLRRQRLLLSFGQIESGALRTFQVCFTFPRKDAVMRHARVHLYGVVQWKQEAPCELQRLQKPESSPAAGSCG
jgi:hypothetical protein